MGVSCGSIRKPHYRLPGAAGRVGRRICILIYYRSAEALARLRSNPALLSAAYKRYKRITLYSRL